MKIIVTEKIADKGIELLQNVPGVEVFVYREIKREELLDVIDQYDAMIVRSVTKVDEELYKRATRLKVVGRAGNGVDNIDMEGATKRGIIVVNTPESNIVSACELTIGLMLASARNMVKGHNLLMAGEWGRTGLRGSEMLHKTLGIIGLGRIGALVTTRMQAFGMKVIAYDPYITDARFKKFGVEKCETLEELLKRADIITIHTPKTEETINIITKKELDLCKNGVRIVNCARGGLINEEDLFVAIKEGKVASAGIDVLKDEPHAVSPLIQLPQCVLTPHIGAGTDEAQDNVGVTIASEVLSALRGEMVANAVNLPTLHPQDLEDMQGYLQLGEYLGKFYYQMEKAVVEKVEIIYQGEVAEMETEMLTRAILKGLLEPILKERVNYVNAALAAEGRGIDVLESKMTTNEKKFSLITLKISGKDGIFTVSGTVLGQNEIRIVEINGYEFDVTPAPFMLVARNQDKPGMIGQIGTLLGASRVNIANMQVSRNNKEGRAMMFMSVDSEVSKDTLNFLQGIDGIMQVNLVKL